MFYKNLISCKVRTGTFPGTTTFEVSPIIGSTYESSTPKSSVYFGNIDSGKLEIFDKQELGNLWIPAWLEVQIINEIDRGDGKSEVLVLFPDGEIFAVSDDRILRAFQKVENLKVVEFFE